MSVHAAGAAGGIIDAQGFRANVGIILADAQGQLLWARRRGQSAWQFPQGGIQQGESSEEALYRELAEEVGLGPEHVCILGSTRRWLRYRLPLRYQRRHITPRCIGQKQIWFLLRFTGAESDVRLDASDLPEFEEWCWVDYWHPVEAVIFFKRHVYQQALAELEQLVFDAPSSEE